MLLNPLVLRLTWATVETLPTAELLVMTDLALIKLIMHQVTRQFLLNGEELCLLYDYISSRLLLIRDMVESRSLQQQA